MAPLCQKEAEGVMQIHSFLVGEKFPGDPVDSRGDPVDILAFSRVSRVCKKKHEEDPKAVYGLWHACELINFPNAHCRHMSQLCVAQSEKACVNGFSHWDVG